MRRKRLARFERGVGLDDAVQTGALDRDQVEDVAPADQQRRTETVHEVEETRPPDAAPEEVGKVVFTWTEVGERRRFDERERAELVDVAERDVDGDDPRPQAGDAQIDRDPARRQSTSCTAFELSHAVNVSRLNCLVVTRR